MKRIIACALLLAALPANAAQLYRWVDEQGRVEWRDTPPPANAKKVEQRNVGGNTIETSTMPYSMQQAVRNFPVTLWTFDCGDPCTKAREHLQKRGVPYTVRDAQKEADTLKKLVGSLEVPVLFVGSKQLRGYLESDWNTALDAAGYPKTAMPGMKTKPQATVGKPGAKPTADTPAKAPAQAR